MTDNKRGSNLIYIIILMAILGILAAAYSAVSIYSARSSAEQRSHEQDYLTAVSLRDTFVNMAESMVWGRYQSDATDPAGQVDIQKFFGAAADEYAEYVSALTEYESLPPAAQAEASEPQFDRSEESITATETLPEGTLKHTHTVTIEEKEKKKPICEMEISIEFKSKETGRVYRLGAKLEPSPPFTFDEPWIDGWKAVRYYEVQ